MARNGMTASIESRLDSLKESVRNLVDVGSERMSDVKDTVVSTGRSGIHRASSLIKKHPIVAIGLAFGIGYIAIRVFRR
jgi:ElaB/YqjD/DUF883 family membrane-anchored ribosome-binding protein